MHRQKLSLYSHWDWLLFCTKWKVRIRDRRRKWSLESKVEHSGSPALESGGSELFEQITRTKVKDMNLCTYSSYFHDENFSSSCVCNWLVFISLFKYFSAEITSIDKACVQYVLLEKCEEKVWIRNRRGKKQDPVISELSCSYSVTQFSALFRREKKRKNRLGIDAASVWRES